MIHLLAFILIASVSEVLSERKVVVLAFDGFRSNNINSGYTPKLFKLRKESAGPKHMVSIFPTKTLATLHSVSTGVYPDNHGIYGNEMFDNDGEVMKYSEKMFNGFNKAILPIWIENQNKGGKSGVMMWPGGEFAYKGVRANYYEPLKKTTSWVTRADQISNWINTEKCNLVMAYFEGSPCNKNGEKLCECLEKRAGKVDDIIEYIRNKIPKDFDMVLFSDHGYNVISGSNILPIQRFFNDITIKKIVSGPLVYLKVPEARKRNTMYSSLKKNEYYFKAYIKEYFPDWHIKNLDAFNEVIVLVATPMYTFMEKASIGKLFSSQKKSISKEVYVSLENGYDNNEDNMNGFFVGIGPGFKDNEFPENVIQLIDVYPLLKALLLLKGNASDVQNMTALSDEMKKFLEPTVVNAYENA